MNGLEAYIDLLENSDLNVGKTKLDLLGQNKILEAALAEERRKFLQEIIKDLKKISL